MEKLLTPEFWQTVLVTAPWVIPLLLVAGVVGYMIKAALDGREIRGLKAENNAAEKQLALAQDEQKAVTAQAEILKLNASKL